MKLGEYGRSLRAYDDSGHLIRIFEWYKPIRLSELDRCRYPISTEPMMVCRLSVNQHNNIIMHLWREENFLRIFFNGTMHPIINHDDLRPLINELIELCDGKQ